MNNFMYTVLNAGILMIYIVVSTIILVTYVIRHLVTARVLEDMNVYIVMSAVIFVMCVKSHSGVRLVL